MPETLSIDQACCDYVLGWSEKVLAYYYVKYNFLQFRSLRRLSMFLQLRYISSLECLLLQNMELVIHVCVNDPIHYYIVLGSVEIS